MKRNLKIVLQLAACLALTLGGAVATQAQDKKVEVTGTWKSSFTNQNGQVRESTFKLKAEGEKLTGTISGRRNDIPIEEGKIRGDEVTFQVTREVNGNKVITKYTAKVSSDTMKGKTEFQRNGEQRTREFSLKKETAAK